MSGPLNGIKELFSNPNCLELNLLLQRNQGGLLLLGGVGAAVVVLLEVLLILAILSCRIPELKRQGAGCTSGYFWRLGPCLCLKRQKTEAEIFEEEQDELARMEAGQGHIVEAYLQGSTEQDSPMPPRPRLLPGAPQFPPSEAESEMESEEEWVEETPRTPARRERPHRREVEPSAFEASAFSTGDELRRPELLLEPSVAPPMTIANPARDQGSSEEMEVLNEYAETPRKQQPDW